jgi:hypothetical protein
MSQPSNQLPRQDSCSHRRPGVYRISLLLPTPLVLAETLADTLAHPFPELGALALALEAQQLGGVEVSGALVVGLAEERDDAEQDGLGRLYGRPALGRRLVPEAVLLGRVQDRDAQLARRVHVGVEGHGRLEHELGRRERVVGREGQVCAEVGTCGL